MNNPKGTKTITVNGEEYRLFLGLSNLADLQEMHGQDFLQKLEGPEDAPAEWLPDMRILCDLFLSALKRYHSDVADRWLVDEIMLQHPNVALDLLAASFPDPAGEGAQGNVLTPPKAVAST